jgi:hypothetical protein
MKPSGPANQKYKPFDLEAAKRGEPIITRDGREVKFIAHVPEAQRDQRVVFLLGNLVYTADEKGRLDKDLDSFADLFMAPKKRTVWVNLCENHIVYWYDSEKEADAGSCPHRLGNKAHMVEIEE